MIAYVFQKYPENYSFQLFIILQQFTNQICYFLKKQPIFQFLLSFLFRNKTVRLNNLKIKTAMSVKISVFVIWAEAIIKFAIVKFYNLLLLNLYCYFLFCLITGYFHYIPIKIKECNNEEPVFRKYCGQK